VLTLLACAVGTGACADVCATTRSFSALLAAHANVAPPSVRLAHADAWPDMSYAYTMAKAELETITGPDGVDLRLSVQ